MKLGRKIFSTLHSQNLGNDSHTHYGWKQSIEEKNRSKAKQNYCCGAFRGDGRKPQQTNKECEGVSQVCLVFGLLSNSTILAYKLWSVHIYICLDLSQAVEQKLNILPSQRRQETDHNSKLTQELSSPGNQFIKYNPTVNVYFVSYSCNILLCVMHKWLDKVPQG